MGLLLFDVFYFYVLIGYCLIEAQSISFKYAGLQMYKQTNVRISSMTLLILNVKESNTLFNKRCLPHKVSHNLSLKYFFV